MTGIRIVFLTGLALAVSHMYVHACMYVILGSKRLTFLLTIGRSLVRILLY